MSEVLDFFDQTKDLQRKASNPEVSSFVSANAGSGKTHVLSMRVIRLMLHGTDPSKILCLTFTKVAAANMATKIFKILAQWTRLSDTELKAQLVEFGEKWPSEALLKTARRLFAQAVETPGGLKIQTIHAFCERLLHLFPFEANVPANFRVIQDIEQAVLLAQAQNEVLTSEEPEVRAALTLLAQDKSEDSFTKLLGEALKRRGAFEAVIASAHPVGALEVELGAALGLTGSATPEDLRGDIIGFSSADLRGFAAALGEASAIGKCLLSAAAAPEDTEIYEAIFFTGTGTPKKQGWLIKAHFTGHPDICAQLEAERERLSALFEHIKAATIVTQTSALVRVVDAVLGRYRRAKALRSTLDFDDLIERTQKLLSGAGRDWVLFKLDQGIDHILVDEAQDTSPAQWQIFRALVDEFFSGNGRSKVERTVFAVGDEKQSIYSFQGAAPQLFNENEQEIKSRIKQTNQTFEPVKLTLSFRSSPAILQAVDDVFERPQNAQGLSFGGDGYPPHTARKANLPGLVEIWPLYAPAPPPPPEGWKLPLDYVSESHPKVLLANQIAQTIAGWLAPESRELVHDADGKPRRIRAGDILILVRSRSNFAEGLNRALKLKHVPVAGADRLTLSSHIAVLDLIAAGRAALLPLDDLQVACVLKSPLFGFDDADLLALAPQRKGSLVAALEASDVARYGQAAQRLQKWQANARQLSPFQFYMRILADEGGRRAMLSRLGQEAADVLDEFLSAALTHEAAGAPSLVNFLAELETSETEIKRDFDAAGEAVRVMTVHSAKGLEAKIVFLADTGAVPNGSKDAKFFKIARQNARETEQPLLAWSPRKDEDCKAVAQARAQQLELALEEHRRLLYVAMTRAEERLYVAGHHALPKPDKADSEKAAMSWYRMIKDSLGGMSEIETPWDETQKILRRVEGNTSGAAPLDSHSAPVLLPAWLHQKLDFEASAQPPLRPSGLLSAATRDESEALTRDDALLRGTLIHRLMQYLPDVADRRAAAQRLMSREGARLTQDARQQLIEDALNILSHPDLAPLFSPEARAEVSISGEVRLNGEMRAVTGRIDRLWAGETEVVFVDFKSGSQRNSPIGQMALYHALLREIYPTHKLKAGVVWTQGPQIEWLSPGALAEALAAMPPA